MLSRVAHPLVAAGALLLAAVLAHAGDWRDGLLLQDSAGDPIRGESLQDQAVLLQFWESWCRSCGKLMSDMDEVAARFPAVRHIVVSIDDDPADAWRRLESHPLFAEHPGRFLHDPGGRLAGYFAVDTVPTVLVIDEDGQERLRHSGHFNSSELQRVTSLLAELGSTSGRGAP